MTERGLSARSEHAITSDYRLVKMGQAMTVWYTFDQQEASI